MLCFCETPFFRIEIRIRILDLLDPEGETLPPAKKKILIFFMFWQLDAVSGGLKVHRGLRIKELIVMKNWIRHLFCKYRNVPYRISFCVVCSAVPYLPSCVVDPWHFGTDPDPDSAIFFFYLQDGNKILFFCLLFFEGTFTSFLR
jgi:hypothetical protein